MPTAVGADAGGHHQCGRYYWVPWQRIRTLALEQPSDLRDYVWMPAGFTWANGGEPWA